MSNINLMNSNLIGMLNQQVSKGKRVVLPFKELSWKIKLIYLTAILVWVPIIWLIFRVATHQF